LKNPFLFPAVGERRKQTGIFSVIPPCCSPLLLGAFYPPQTSMTASAFTSRNAGK